MDVKREGEGSMGCDRSERFFQMDADWFFTIRGGRHMGPFATKRDAIGASGEYIRGQSKLSVVRAAAGAMAVGS